MLQFKEMVENHTDKPITEFNENDTLYTQKTIAGYSIFFLIKFIKFERGYVFGEFIHCNSNYDRTHKDGDILKVKVSNCMTWTERRGCHWFRKNDGKNWNCKSK